MEPGNLPDLVILTRNPLEQIEYSDRVLYIMVNRQLYDAETMDGLWPGTKPHSNTAKRRLTLSLIME